MTWSAFLLMTVFGLGFAGLVWLEGRRDDARWKRQREAEEAQGRPAE